MESGDAKMIRKRHGLMVAQVDTGHGQAEQKLNISAHFNKTDVLLCWVFLIYLFFLINTMMG